MIKKTTQLALGVLATTCLLFFVLGPTQLQAPVSNWSNHKTEKAVVEKAKPELPAKKVLSTPYTVQAPSANWAVHEESCEEAALLMNHYYLRDAHFSGKDIIPAQTADRELRKMKAWQINAWGREPDLDLDKLGFFAQEYYGHKYEVIDNITADDIRKAIASDKLVNVPVITHALKNPHYGSTPSYHILVIKGYDAKGVITNDAGIKEGQNWHYSWEVLFGAIDAQSPKMNPGRSMLTLGL